ncbi:MAG TPA: hypothetical protein VMT76_11965 [Puia sp.]|nr:hypothetical protein [Puia sp.]
MLTLEFPVNALILLAISAISVFIGFSLRRTQVINLRKKLLKAENEMINSHAEILEIQKEYINMEMKMRAVKDPVTGPVITNEAGYAEKTPDGVIRKKMLTKDFLPNRKEGYNPAYDNVLNKEVNINKAS